MKLNKVLILISICSISFFGFNQRNKIPKAVKKELKDFKRAISLRKEIDNSIEDFIYLKEGKPYLVTNRKSLTSSENEKSIFIFYGDKYILYTVPDKFLLNRLYKNSIWYTSSSAKGGAVVINTKTKNEYRKKVEVIFKKSIQNNSVFLGGLGDELITTKEIHYEEFEEEIMYYYYYSTLHCDIEFKKDFSEHYYNPYIETGTINKTIDYNLIRDQDLIDKLKNQGVNNKKSADEINLEMLEINFVPSDNIKMIFPQKVIKYELDDKFKGNYTENYIEYKGTFYYYKPKSVVSYYGFIQYNKYFKKSNLMNSLSSISNDFQVSEAAFNELYKSFEEDYGNGKRRRFLNSSYKYVLESVLNLMEGEISSIKRPSLKRTPNLISTEEKVFNIVEIMPEFPGGNSAYSNYLQSKLKYPESAKDLDIQGSVIVEFIVSKDGNVKDVSIIKGVHKLLDDEALRLIKDMPNWKPGSQNGEPVNVKMLVPIKFVLE